MTIVASNNITVSNVNDGTITHTAYSWSVDGSDRFTTVYPNLNLLTDGRFLGQPTPKWTPDGTIISKDETTGFFKIQFSGNTVNNRTYYGNALYEIPVGQKYSISVKAYSLESSLDVKFGTYNGSRTITIANNGNTPNVYKIEGIVKTDSNALSILGGTSQTLGTLFISEIKLEKGGIATPYMPSSSEVTTADWPSYIGQYSDFTSTVSTDPATYAPWTIFKGNDGIGVTSTVITYTISTSGTTAPSTGWTSTVPSPVKGQYLWTKTVWAYTDNSSKTGYSVTYISKDGTNGTDGTSGIIVSSVAPDSPQTGQLWQDTSTTPQLVKKWTGASWVIWKMYVENMAVDTISSMSSDLGDVTAGTVTLMDDVAVGDTLKKYGIYQSKLGLLSSGPSLSAPGTFSDSKMGVANLNRGELRFIVNDYTENLKTVQETGMSDTNNAFIKFDSYDNGKDVMVIGSSGDIVFKGITSQDTPWIAMLNGAYYKNMFSRVYISYSVQATSTANIPLGVLPVGLRPFRGLHLTANAWATTLGNDRHIEVRTTGEVTLYSPANGASYDGEVSFTI